MTSTVKKPKSLRARLSMIQDSQCPLCGGPNTQWSQFEYETPLVYQRMYCKDCDKHINTFYKLCSYSVEES